MNKLTLLFCIFFITAKSYSQIFVDNFNYPQGIYLFQTGNWTNIGMPVSPITVLSPGLTFPGYQGSGIGNMAALSAAGGNSVYSLLSSVQTDGSVYASFMLKVIYPFTDGEHFFSLRSSDTGYYAKVYIKEYDSPEFQLAITKSNQYDVHFTSPLFNVGETYLFVVKYKFISGSNNDEVSLFVFNVSSPPPLTEPLPTILPESNDVPDAPNLDGVVLWQGQTQSPLFLYVDGIYVNRGWFPDGALPVELISFTSGVSKQNVILNWTTSAEKNNSHFEIERSSGSVWTKTGTVKGNGTSSYPVSYTFTDKNLTPGIYKYRLKQIDFNGNSGYHNLADEVEIKNPAGYSISQNYPNPFNPSTTIGYEIPADGNVSIKVFDITGKEIATLVNEFKQAGYHSVELNASDLPGGIYLYRIEASNIGNRFSDSKRMILLK